MIDTTNVLGCGDHSHGASKDPLEACLPHSSGILRDVQPLGHQVGLADAITDGQANNAAAWKVDNVTSNAAAAAPLDLVPPTSTDPLLLRLTSPTDASDVLGSVQAQFGGGAGGAARGRFFFRGGLLISFLSRARTSNAGGAMLLGLCNVATGLLNPNGTISAALTDGSFFYRAPGATQVAFVVRRGGATVASVVVSTTFAAGSYYEMGFRADALGNGLIASWTDANGKVETAVALAANQVPNAALDLTYVVGGNARTLDVQRSFAAQEAI